MNMIEEKKFTSSINIKFDLGKKEFIERYLPTPSHAEALLGLLKGFNNKRESHSHIVIGPYGTGKSLLGTLVGGIVSKNIEAEIMDVLIKKFQNVDDEILSELNKISKSNRKYIPVILNGHEGSFRQAIISAIIRALKNNGINMTVPGMVNNILKVVKTWRTEFPNTYESFKQKLKLNNKNVDVWKSNVESYNKKEIEWFKEIFPTLTSGAQFVVDFNDDFVGQIIHVLNELSKRDVGLFVIYDEFGRFLQSMGSSEVFRTMQDLQDIAELSNHYSGALQQLFITHKNFRHYFMRYNEEYQNEFQRIEKRFKLYYINSDRNTFVRLTESMLSTTMQKDNSIDYMKNVTMLRKYPLFPDLNQVEIEEIVIRGAYPIHPVTLYLLPQLSNLFAQNERTLFTFLESDELGGLYQHMKKSADYYLPYRLFDYFFLDSNQEIDNSSIKIIDTYKRLTRKVPLLSPESSDQLPHNLVKFITLWNLCGLNSQFKLTSEFLAFAFESELVDLENILDEMSTLKVVRFNRIIGCWELYEGSAIDLDRLINQSIENTSITRDYKLKVLEDNLDKKFFLPNNYNDDKNMTRFAAVNFVYSGDILTEIFDSRHYREKKSADALINYVLLEDPIHYKDLIKILSKWDDNHAIFSLSTTSFAKVDGYIAVYKVITDKLNDEEFLSQDPLIEEELILKKEDIVFEIQQFIKVFTSFDDNLTWYHRSLDEKYEINNSIVLERFLSKLMQEIYPNTPEIRNDSFNRRKINNVQLNAGYKVVDHLINSPYEKVIGIKGNGPEYLIYATIFKNNGVNLQSLNNIHSENMALLRKRLSLYFTKNQSGTLQSLVDILTEPPYGIRRPLVPILLIGLLRDKWEQMMFYRNEMYVSGIDGKAFYHMVDEANEYEYKFYDFNEEYRSFFENLSDLFGDHTHEQSVNKPKPIMISSSMLGWLRSLPRFTQTTSCIESALLQLKDNIRRSEVNPQQFIEKLYTTYRKNIDDLTEHKIKLDNFISEHKNKLRSMVLIEIDKPTYKDLCEWAYNQAAYKQKNNELIKSIINSHEDRWIDDLAISIVGVPIEDWSDTTNDMFEKNIKDNYKSINTDYLDDDYISFSINGKEKAILKADLSTKSRTIYNNVHRMIKNAGRNVSKDEIEFLVLNLVEEFVD